MHLFMILAALALAGSVRVSWSSDTKGTWTQRWQRSLWFFLFPPLLLAITGIAVLCMGTQGTMMGLQVGWFSYLLILVLFAVATFLGLKLAWEGWRSLQQTRTYPLQDLEDRSVRVLETPTLFSALIGFWQPELVVTQGMLQVLTPAQLAAVIAHEQAHHYYRDTFWFFWLGWVRTCTAWLPHTEALWQELLLLRELRADRWAAQIVDPLILAESLLLVVRSSVMPMTSFCAAFSAPSQSHRLTERIEALLAESESLAQPQLKWSWLWLLLAFLPLATVPFHS
jgi:Zn-dependent protease with chaperone function